jgi:hypothetical protein
MLPENERYDAARKAMVASGRRKHGAMRSRQRSLITDLVKGDADRGVAPWISSPWRRSLASVLMIQEHYRHLQREHARNALAKLALA